MYSFSILQRKNFSYIYIIYRNRGSYYIPLFFVRKNTFRTIYHCKNRTSPLGMDCLHIKTECPHWGWAVYTSKQNVPIGEGLSILQKQNVPIGDGLSILRNRMSPLGMDCLYFKNRMSPLGMDCLYFKIELFWEEQGIFISKFKY
jgi:hypothetical protein